MPEQTITAVLLIPKEGDPHKILGDADSVAWKCGARPPTAQEYTDGLLTWWQFGPHDRHAENRRMRETQRAALRTGRSGLVLVGDGEEVLVGVDIADRAAWISEHRWPPGEDLENLLEEFSGRDIGTLVLLDENGREVQSCVK